MNDVVIVDSGVANLASVTAAFTRLGAAAAVTGEADLVRKFLDCAKFSARPVDAARIVETVLHLDRQSDMARLLGE